MSAAVMSSTLMDVGETFHHNRRNSSSACRTQQQQTAAYDRRQWSSSAFSASSSRTTSYSVSRHRNLSGPSTTGARPSLDIRALATPPPGVPGAREGSKADSSSTSSPTTGNRNSSHRRLDRSLSDVEDGLNGNGRGVNSSRYKTELCRPFEESGHCKYGDKCQFAHGAHELRNLTRHPKYKTERCRTYHTIGFCPYGPRCHFIHNEDEQTVGSRKASRQPPQQQQQQQQQQNRYIVPSSPSSLAQRPTNLCGLTSLGSSFESVSTTSSSPGNLSPSHLTEDLYPSITTFSPSSTSESSAGAESESPSSVFNFPASDALGVGSVLTPLNIQTQQMYNNVVDMAAMHISAVLNISQNQHKNGSSAFTANLNMCANVSHSSKQAAFEPEAAAADKVWSVFEVTPDMGVAFPPPSTSPVSSNSDDSMGSTGSLEMTSTTSSLDNSDYLVNSPLEIGRCMRLPIFNQLSLEP